MRFCLRMVRTKPFSASVAPDGDDGEESLKREAILRGEKVELQRGRQVPLHGASTWGDGVAQGEYSDRAAKREARSRRNGALSIDGQQLQVGR